MARSATLVRARGCSPTAPRLIRWISRFPARNEVGVARRRVRHASVDEEGQKKAVQGCGEKPREKPRTKTNSENGRPRERHIESLAFGAWFACVSWHVQTALTLAADLDNADIFYVLHQKSNATWDSFHFKVVDEGESPGLVLALTAEPHEKDELRIKETSIHKVCRIFVFPNLVGQPVVCSAMFPCPFSRVPHRVLKLRGSPSSRA
ncbi:hypothetical protein HPB50_026493 [Hyalomma asiaticum]|uniref:Uncharacterized protein n=1 Tax=Hyalomma asiaticum TaxID=266040 RepID=A0ACB7SRE1_HYAAI|nr:hypothetical protein HPB50_026493 [Hyalomma asiaticum]